MLLKASTNKRLAGVTVIVLPIESIEYVPAERQHILYTLFLPFRRQCMQFGNCVGNFGGSAVRRPFGHDSAAVMSKLVALVYTEFHADCP